MSLIAAIVFILIVLGTVAFAFIIILGGYFTLKQKNNPNKAQYGGWRVCNKCGKVTTIRNCEHCER